MLSIAIASCALLTFLVTRHEDLHQKMRVFNNPLISGLVIGGGGGLISWLFITLVSISMPHSLRGPAWVIIPYSFFLVISVLTIKFKTDKNHFLKLFLTAFLAFFVMSITLYLFTNLDDYFTYGSFPTHRLLHTFVFIICLGIFSCTTLTFLVTRRL